MDWINARSQKNHTSILSWKHSKNIPSGLASSLWCPHWGLTGATYEIQISSILIEVVLPKNCDEIRGYFIIILLLPNVTIYLDKPWYLRKRWIYICIFFRITSNYSIVSSRTFTKTTGKCCIHKVKSKPAKININPCSLWCHNFPILNAIAH